MILVITLYVITVHVHWSLEFSRRHRKRSHAGVGWGQAAQHWCLGPKGGSSTPHRGHPTFLLLTEGGRECMFAYVHMYVYVRVCVCECVTVDEHLIKLSVPISIHLVPINVAPKRFVISDFLCDCAA